MSEFRWVKDVLADLEVFTSDNNLPELSEKIREAKTVAQMEIDSETVGTKDESENTAFFDV